MENSDVGKLWVVVRVEGYDEKNRVGVMRPVFWDKDPKRVKETMAELKAAQPDLILYPIQWNSEPRMYGKNSGRYSVPPGVSPALDKATQAAREQKMKDVKLEATENIKLNAGDLERSRLLRDDRHEENINNMRRRSL